MLEFLKTCAVVILLFFASPFVGIALSIAVLLFVLGLPFWLLIELARGRHAPID